MRLMKLIRYFHWPQRSVFRASASGVVGRRFAPRPRHTKGDRMVLVAPLLILAKKCSARKIQEGR